MSPRYRVTLTGQERDDLEALTKRGRPTPEDLSMPVHCYFVMLVRMVQHGLFPMWLKHWV